MEKSRIVEALGEEGLRLPALLNEALAANDRAKYLFTVLQVAQGHAERPGSAAPELRAEREAAGLAAAGFDEVAAAATKTGDGRYYMPGVERLCTRLRAEIDAMLAPLLASGEDAAAYDERRRRLDEVPWCGADDQITGDQIGAIASGGHEGTDSVHRLVMDMHKALNGLQARISSEIIEGAHAYGIAPGDRPLVAAFMRGVNRTAALKFDHPGLGTTATRSGDRLVLQNDIGTTDAHVLVVHVEANRATLTYTDVHMQRLVFFQGLFDARRVEWADTLSRTDRSMADGVYHLCVGSFTAASDAELEDYLAFMGSRLVFLIDWNRARKRLRLLLPRKEVAELLKWAADNDHGHMAFLRAGGEQMIFDSLAFVSRAPSSFGARLDDVLGHDAAVKFMRYVMRTCAQGLQGGRPEGLVRDEVRAELVSYFRSAQESVLDVAAEHAAFALEIASGIRDALLSAGAPSAGEAFARNARRAKAWEHRADELVNAARAQARHSERARTYRDLIEVADDIVDELEEAAFHLALMPHDGRGEALYAALRPLAALAVESVQEYLKAVETARTLHRGSPREDTQDFLEAVHRIMTLERRGDEVHRSAKSLVPAQAGEFAGLFGFIECARNLEGATDALMHTALKLRDAVLGELVVQ
ncbi:MAG TPA: hypothetical protein VFV55_08435 [Usitatibacteraceae bacterium]|nr:hypothetical protein [Usitatibacteraceae bacterium]